MLQKRKKVVTKIRSEDGKFAKVKDFHMLIDPYINELKNKYQSQIQVNAELLKNQRLTQTDYVTTQLFVPYQQIVPAFPFLTRSDPLGLSSLLN